jgi:glycosyltransferase involved in cell wall biosynthesis
MIHNLVRAYPGETLTVCFDDRREPHVELAARLDAEGFRAQTLPSSGAFDPLAPVRFAGILRSFRPDIVHSHDYKSDTLAWLTGRRRGARIVSTLHGNLRTTAALARYEKLDAWLLRRFDRVAAVSAERRQEALAYGVHPSRVEVVPNGVDTGLFRPLPDRQGLRRHLSVPDEGLLAGVVGRLSAEKGHALLIEAVAALGARGASIRLAFIGDGPLEPELRREAGRAGLSDRVHFCGRCDDMPGVYNALDVVVLPSLSEGLPMTVIEAAACARPVLATDVGAIGRVVREGATGYLVPANDPTALADGLARIIADLEEAERRGRAARDLVVREFSSTAMAAAYIAFYRRALGRECAGGPGQ